MRNRAKCKLCNRIIESVSLHDHVVCDCGHIAISGGPDNYKAFADNWDNFLRIEDNGTEKPVVIVNENHAPTPPLSHSELIDMLDAMIKTIDDLPPHARMAPITHADYGALLVLLSELFKSQQPSSPLGDSSPDFSIMTGGVTG